jgi:hypothetical protein
MLLSDILSVNSVCVGVCVWVGGGGGGGGGGGVGGGGGGGAGGGGSRDNTSFL